MNTTTMTAIAAAIIATATIAVTAAMTWKREMFEQERIKRADQERMERNKQWIDKMDEISYEKRVPCMPFMPMNCYGMMNHCMPYNGGRQIDVNWSDDGPSPLAQRFMNNFQNGNNRLSSMSHPYSYGYGYNNTNNSTDYYRTSNDMEFTFDNNDSVIRMIASRPPVASPLFGYNRAVA